MITNLSLRAAQRDAAPLPAMAQRLAESRQACQRARAHLSRLEWEFAQRLDVQEAQATLEAAQHEQASADALLRQMLLAAYQMTGQRQFAGIGSVRIMQQVYYLIDGPALFAAVAATMPDLILHQVDRRRLEKRLRHEPQAAIPGIVEVRREPKTFINSMIDL